MADPQPIKDALAAIRAAEHDLSTINLAAAPMFNVRSAEAHLSDALLRLADARGELGKPVLTVVSQTDNKVT